MPIKSLWIEAAWLHDLEYNVRIVMDAGRITDVQTGVDAKEEDLVRSGVALPGFVNTHSHAFHRLLRGKTHVGVGSFWAWQDEMYRLAERLTPDIYRQIATAVFTEMALAGITTVGEFHYVHHTPDGTPYDDPNAMGVAMMEAAAVAGVRLTLIDTCYLRGWFDRPVDGVQRRFSDGSVENWVRRVSGLEESATVRHAAGVHSVRAVAPGDIAAVVRYARANGMPVHAHVSEQPIENEECLDHTGSTPVGVFAGADAIQSYFTAVHATHLTTDDVQLLGSGGATVCLCPTTERELADGIGPSAELVAAGASIALGTDSHAVVDMLTEMRLVELHERLATLTRGAHGPRQLLDMGTERGARSLGWPDAGRIEVGALADIAVVSLDTVRTVGDVSSALNAVVFSATSSDVTDTIVGGEGVVLGGRHVRHGNGVGLLRVAQGLVAE
ncbi:8-oxoguanine deaminase [bacterium BMS3Bbin02]|nr:8-oxoguanine deaminase [bacterium BMS3Bbin02]